MNVWVQRTSGPQTEHRNRQARHAEPVLPGDYFHSERALFRVERCDYGRALVENCRTGELIDVELDHLLRLARIDR